MSNGFESHFSNTCAPCDDFLYPTFPWLAYGNFTATVSKALKPNNTICVGFPLPSAMRER